MNNNLTDEQVQELLDLGFEHYKINPRNYSIEMIERITSLIKDIRNER